MIFLLRPAAWVGGALLTLWAVVALLDAMDTSSMAVSAPVSQSRSAAK